MENLIAKHGEKFQDPTRDQVHEIHDVYADFVRAQPWRQIEDGHIIVHHHPQAGDTYTIVVGALGEVRGIATYIGEDGLRYLTNLLFGGPLKLHGGAPRDTYQTFEDANSLYVTSADREEMTDEERKILRNVGIRYRGRGNWVQVHRTVPGFIPYRTDADETRFVTSIMRDVMDIAAEISNDNLNPERWGSYDALLNSTWEDGRWTHDWRKPAPIPPYPDTLHVDLTPVQNLPKSKDEWLVGDVGAGITRDPSISHRSFRVMTQMSMDVSTSLITTVETQDGPASTASRQQALLTSFERYVSHFGSIPGTVIANDESTFIAIEPLCHGLDITLMMTRMHHPFERLMFQTRRRGGTLQAPNNPDHGPSGGCGS